MISKVVDFKNIISINDVISDCIIFFFIVVYSLYSDDIGFKVIFRNWFGVRSLREGGSVVIDIK